MPRPPPRDPEVFAALGQVWIGGRGYQVLEAARHKNQVLLWLDGVHSRSQAEELAGLAVQGDRRRFPPLPHGEYYWFQVLGLPVINVADGARLGHLDHIISTPGHDVYVVRGGRAGGPAAGGGGRDRGDRPGGGGDQGFASGGACWNFRKRRAAGQGRCAEPIDSGFDLPRESWKLMQIDLLTLFPEFFASPLSQSMLHRAQVQGAVTYGVINLRDYAGDRHQVTDDRPFGGGPGMVMKIEPLVAAIRAAQERDPETRVILLGPGGAAFNQAKARELAG